MLSCSSSSDLRVDFISPQKALTAFGEFMVFFTSPAIDDGAGIRWKLTLNSIYLSWGNEHAIEASENCSCLFVLKKYPRPDANCRPDTVRSARSRKIIQNVLLYQDVSIRPQSLGPRDDLHQNKLLTEVSWNLRFLSQVDNYTELAVSG